MKTARYILPFLWLLVTIPLLAQSEGDEKMKHYAEQYAKCDNAGRRLHLANDFFAYLLQIDYIDEPIAFPADSHIDSVDVNVYYYVAEWYYGEGDYQTAINYCTRAEACMGVVDDASRSDVYALAGAVYFRMGSFDKAAEALNRCYELDKKSGDFDRMSSTLNGIASVFVAAGKPQEAEKYILEAIAANSLTDNLSRRALLYGTTSEIYRSMNDASQSLEYAEKALATERQLGDSARIGVRLSQLASAQLALSKVVEARRSLKEAMPLLLGSGNLHSWGICQNQMGDILASEDENDEAAKYYTEAAKLFMEQGDKYNELHAREGLYRVTKTADPSEAMMHLERAKQLQDSIYQHETAETLGKYNALYYNDILQKEKQQEERRHRNVLIAVILTSLMLFVVIGIVAARNQRQHKQKEEKYKHDIDALQEQNNIIARQYENMIAEVMQTSEDMTEDDKQFLKQLTGVISALSEKGITDIETISQCIRLSPYYLHRRLSRILSVTPKAYILQVRMQKAQYLFNNYRDITVSEVAFRCGYTQLGNFTRAFTRYYGFTPSDARKQ